MSSAFHDLHAWQITAGFPLITTHLIAADGADHHQILHEWRRASALEHSTIQVEHISRPLEADAHA